MTPLLALLAAYAVVLVIVGVVIGRRVRTSGEFFVSGRSLGPWLVFATFLAPNIGAGSTVGATALAYHQGLAAWWWNGSAGIGSLILAFWIGPRIWHEARRLGLLTVGDFLEHHFGKAVRNFAAIVIWLGSLLILCGQIDGAGAVLAIAGNISPRLGCLIATLVMTAYFATGGLAAAARVNGVQLAVKLIGFAIATPLVVAAAGGWPTLAAVAPSHATFWRGTTTTAGWPLLFLTGPAFFLSPGLLQKAFSARDTHALTRGVAWNGVALLVFGTIPVALGLAARVLYPQLADADVALTVLTRIPVAVGGLALAAVFSAEMSAADAVVFMLSTSGARDLYRGMLRPRATDAEVLRAARVFAVLGGAVGYGLTFVLGTVLGALTMFYSLMIVTLCAPILGGLFFPKAGRGAAAAAMIVGLATLVATTLATGGAGYGWASPSFVGLVTSSATYTLLAIF